jgi:hypothetical protein
MTLKAKYAGRCYGCPDPIEVGDEITIDAELGQFVHVECKSVPPRPEVVCTTCFMVKPCECDDE